MKIRLNDRDCDVIETSCWDVRALTFDQIADNWWGPTITGHANARKRLARLVVGGFLARSVVLTRPVQLSSKPLAHWRLGDPALDCAAVSWLAEKRWNRPMRRTTVFSATGKAAHTFGGIARGKLKNVLQLSHDLHTAGIFLQLRRTEPARATLWVPEDLLPHERRNTRVPDAMLVDGDLQLLAIEFIAGYPPRRIESFHRWATGRRLEHQLW